MTGIIKNYIRERNFGFIYSGDTEIFYHVSEFVDKTVVPEAGMSVSFELQETVKGNQAHKICVIEDKRISKFLIFGDVRIKTSNIKNYGITNESNSYLNYVNSSTKGTGNYDEVLKVKEIELQQTKKIWAGHPDIIAREELSYEDSKKFFAECILNKDKLLKSIEYQLALQGKLEFLYVTTYQGDNFRFYAHTCGFNVREKLNELDILLC